MGRNPPSSITIFMRIVCYVTDNLSQGCALDRQGVNLPERVLHTKPTAATYQAPNMSNFTCENNQEGNAPSSADRQQPAGLHTVLLLNYQLVIRKDGIDQYAVLTTHNGRVYQNTPWLYALKTLQSNLNDQLVVATRLI